MVQAAAAYGYGGATVERVIERGAVSRATFYEQFSSREDCFLAAFHDVVSKMRGHVRDSRGNTTAASPLNHGLEATLDFVSCHPEAARLVLVEALAAGRAAEAEHEALMGEIDRSIRALLDAAPQGARSLHVEPLALRGGVAGVLSSRLLSGEGASVRDLLDDLVSWANSYALAPGEAIATTEWVQLGREAGNLLREADGETNRIAPMPRGRHALSPAAAADARRARILDALAHLVRLKGYRALTVADIVARARVTRGAFYSHFRGKEDAFLAAQHVALQESMAAAASAASVSTCWPDRVWRASAAMFRYMEGTTDLVHLGVLGAHTAGPVAARRAYQTRMAFAIFLEEGYRQTRAAQRLPLLCSEAIAGAVFALMWRQARSGRAFAMLEILPEATYLALAPFLGPRWALEFIESKLRPAGSTAARPATVGRAHPRPS